MTGLSTDATIDGVDATVTIADGRVAMNGQVAPATLRVERPDCRPLSEAEPHATLRVADNGVRLVVDLDGHGLDGLADAIVGIQERGRDE